MERKRLNQMNESKYIFFILYCLRSFIYVNIRRNHCKKDFLCNGITLFLYSLDNYDISIPNFNKIILSFLRNVKSKAINA